ncbi:MAG TPA: putative 2OG-Fe(II) oxygenase [Caulobacteraceae bacterium]|jgi:tetratricopeptide (TPR) repeat protein
MSASETPAQRALALLNAGRTAEALAAIEPHARLPGAPHPALAAYSLALKTATRLEEALEVSRRAARDYPASAAAEHNVAALLGDLNRPAEAEAAARRALAKGGDAPETWLTLGRALIEQGRAAEAEAALREAVRRRPEMADAHRELAQVVWMTTGDRDASAAPLRGAVAANPRDPALAIQLAKALQYGGREDEAYGVLQTAIRGSNQVNFALEATAASLAAVRGDPGAALDHAYRALTERPGDVPVGILACDAYLGLGRAEEAAQLAARLHQLAPNEQQVLSRLAVAWRILGDPRYRVLYDYARVVRPWRIDTPEGWPDLPSYLADLAAALKRLHTFTTHPFDQSLRHGSQTPQNLKTVEEPAVRAFFAAIDGPIRRHMAMLGTGPDPLRSRNTGRYDIAGIWSVRLRPNGFHIDHVHHEGWLSSACYIELPPAVEAEGREGWIKFGEPGVPTEPPLPPEHFVKPERGMLVLFPSYMWHGTVPFSGDATRMTIAFDVVPA